MQEQFCPSLETLKAQDTFIKGKTFKCRIVQIIVYAELPKEAAHKESLLLDLRYSNMGG